MKPMLLPMALMAAIALSGCGPRDQPAGTAAPTPTPAAPSPVAPAPIPAPVSTIPNPPDGERTQATWSGYDAMRFGMDEAAFRKAWAGELKKDAPMEGSTCYHLYPTWVKVPADMAYMFEEGKFVRYSVEGDTFIAPGGGKVGMTKAQIATLYAGRIEEQPHHYVDGQYLRIKAADGGAGVLIFETDGKTDAAKVTQWRVGVSPQVDYVEGCA